MLPPPLHATVLLMRSPAQLLVLQRKLKRIMQLSAAILVYLMAVRCCGKKEKGEDPGRSSLLLLELISVQVCCYASAALLWFAVSVSCVRHTSFQSWEYI